VALLHGPVDRGLERDRARADDARREADEQAIALLLQVDAAEDDDEEGDALALAECFDQAGMMG